MMKAVTYQILAYVWLFVGPFILYGLIPQTFHPATQSTVALGRICPNRSDFYDSQFSACRYASGEIVDILENIYPPDYEKYPDSARIRAEAYARSQNGALGTTGVDRQLKEAFAKQMGRAAYVRAIEEWGSKQRLPVLRRIEFSDNKQGFAEETSIYTKTTEDHWTPSTFHLILMNTIIVLFGFVGLFVASFKSL